MNESVSLRAVVSGAILSAAGVCLACVAFWYLPQPGTLPDPAALRGGAICYLPSVGHCNPGEGDIGCNAPCAGAGSCHVDQARIDESYDTVKEDDMLGKVDFDVTGSFDCEVYYCAASCVPDGEFYFCRYSAFFIEHDYRETKEEVGALCPGGS